MPDDDFLVKLREAFAAEAAEHLQALTSGLLALEKTEDINGRPPLLESIYREAHSLKGAAGAVDHLSIQTICQELESVFSQWKRHPDQPIPTGAFDITGAAVDEITRLLDSHTLPSPGAPPPLNVTEIVKSIQSLLASRPSPAQSPKIHNAPHDLGGPTNPPALAQVADPSPAAATVRMPVARLDSLLRQVEEMITARLATHQHASVVKGLTSHLESWEKHWARFRQQLQPAPGLRETGTLAACMDFLQWTAGHLRIMEKQLAQSASAFAQDERSVSSLVEHLLEDAKRLVMIPCSILLDPVSKVVRDLVRELGKEVDLSLAGREVEVDKRVLQELKDPLLHLVRNALDHGIETTAQRRTAGKPVPGKLSIAVRAQEGSKVELSIQDDGAGIDTRRLKSAAIASGYLTAESAESSDETTLQSLVFKSGLSTSPQITSISGRGLGLAIVQEKVAKLGGKLSVQSTLSEGTSFVLTVPVTLATFKGVFVELNDQVYVLPTAAVDRVIWQPRSSVQTVENRETVLLDDCRIPLVAMDTVLELSPREHPPIKDTITAVVLGEDARRVAFTVDGILTEQEILVKPLPRPLVRVRNVAGATLLPSGAPVVILNPADLLHSAARATVSTRSRRSATKHRRPNSPARKILVTDDSVTSRMLLKNILQSAGYDVSVAVDGVDAYTALKTRDFDLLVSDVQMPRMDGFDLTSKVRSDKRLANLPVVLVTALGSREDRERGVDVGANAYVVKSSFDQQNLLEVIHKLL